MKLRLPSPAMVVAVIALIVALSGTAIAAVNFAQNAGAVDGRSAVGAKASLRSAAGKLVATSTGGNGKGQIPARFLDGVMRGGTMTLSKYLRTVDNQAGHPTPLLIVPGVLPAAQTRRLGAARRSVGRRSHAPAGRDIRGRH